MGLAQSSRFPVNGSFGCGHVVALASFFGQGHPIGVHESVLLENEDSLVPVTSELVRESFYKLIPAEEASHGCEATHAKQTRRNRENRTSMRAALG